MKIRIKKEIPGYKVGEIMETGTSGFLSNNNPNYHNYSVKNLIKESFAEEIKDDIDIEAIRREKSPVGMHHNNHYFLSFDNADGEYSNEELEFFRAYRIVKAVIDQLNGDWKPDWQMENKVFCICFNHEYGKLDITYDIDKQYNILPYCKNEETAQKVIELCEPELKVLFNIK